MTQTSKGVSYVALRPYPFGGGRSLALALSLDKYSLLPETHLVTTSGDESSWSFLPMHRLRTHTLRALQPPIGASFAGILLGLRDAMAGADVVDVAEVSNPLSAQILGYSHRRSLVTIVTVIETCTKRFIDKLPPWTLYSRYAVNRTNLFRVYTHRSKEYLSTLGVPDDKIRVLPLGIDVDFFHPGTRDAFSEKYRILYARRLEDKNGILSLIRSVMAVRKSVPGTELWVAGTGPLAERVRELSRKLPIRMLGAVSYDTLARVYRDVDVYCNAGRDTTLLGREFQEDGQFTFPLLEAQASGLPVVSTASGSNSELLSLSNVQVGQTDSAALTEGLLRFADRKTRLTVGAENVDFIRRGFDASQLQPKFDSLVQSLLAKRPAN